MLTVYHNFRYSTGCVADATATVIHSAIWLTSNLCYDFAILMVTTGIADPESIMTVLWATILY